MGLPAAGLEAGQQPEVFGNLDDFFSQPATRDVAVVAANSALGATSPVDASKFGELTSPGMRSGSLGMGLSTAEDIIERSERVVAAGDGSGGATRIAQQTVTFPSRGGLEGVGARVGVVAPVEDGREEFDGRRGHGRELERPALPMALARLEHLRAEYAAAAESSAEGGAGRGVGSMANFDRLSLQVLQSARVRRIALWSAPLWCFHLWRTAPGQEALDCFFDWLVDEERRVVVVAFFGFLPLLTLNSLSAGLAAAVYDSEADDPPAANAPWKGRHRYFLRQLEGPWMLSTMAASLLLPNGDRYKTFLWVQVDKARVGVVVLLNAAIPLVMLAFGYLAVEGGCWLADSTGSLAMSLAARYRRGSEAFPSLAAAAPPQYDEMLVDMVFTHGNSPGSKRAPSGQSAVGQSRLDPSAHDSPIPRRASVCSTRTEPASRATSAIA